MPERTWHRTRGFPAFRSPLSRHPRATSKSKLDPNDEQDRQSAKEWIGFSDWYGWPHTIQFRSWPDLIAKLKSTNLQAVSKNMGDFNQQNKAEILESWKDVLQRVARNKAYRQAQGEPMERTFDQAMAEDYKVTTTANCWASSRAAPLTSEELAKSKADEKLRNEIKAKEIMRLAAQAHQMCPETADECFCCRMTREYGYVPGVTLGRLTPRHVKCMQEIDCEGKRFRTTPLGCDHPSHCQKAS